MAGTDRRAEQAAAAGPVTILVEPQMGENIGAAARAMWNFGLDRLRLVAPRDGWPNPGAVAMASGAGRVLDAATVHADTASATADLTHVYATTARPRELTKRVLTPAAAMAEARARIAAGERVGILYGRERTGLENADVVRAGSIVSVPANPGFGSLNLGQCVLLVSYEWFRRGDATPAAELLAGRARPATGVELDRLLAHLLAELDAEGFFRPPEKRPTMQANLENLFRRAGLTDQEVRTLWGVIRTLAGKRRGR